MDNAVAPGDVVAGRYRLDEQLGSGGFGAVFRATDLRSGSPVAVKVLRGAGTDRTTRARFEREAALLRRIEHPGVVRALDHGATPGGQLFLVLELLPGEDLSALLARRGRLDAREVTHVLAQLLSALAAAHDAGMVHRDLKPENIRVVATPDDPLRVKLLDFGIARPTDDGSPSLTATGELIGTPRYMSPEQLTGRPLTPASDLYSVGLVALELLMGREALHGNQWGDQLDRLQTGHLFALPQAADPLQANLTRVITRMTARDPLRRFGNARQALAALTPSAPPSRPDARRAERFDARRAAIFAVPLIAVIAIGLAKSFLSTAPAPTPVRQAFRPAPPTLHRPQPDPPSARPAATPSTDAGTATQDPLDGCGREVVLGPARFPFGAAYVPQDYDPQRRHPLLIAVHDDQVEADRLIRDGGFAELAETHGLVVIAPQDVDPRFGLLGAMASAWRDDEADLLTIEQALETTTKSFCIDRTRVFVVGVVHGGHMARDLAAADWVTGAASVAHHYSNLPEPRSRAPYLLTLPLASEEWPATGIRQCETKSLRSHKEVEQAWLRQNRCRGTHKTSEYPGGSCAEYSCETPLVVCRVEGGLGWPGVPRATSGFGRCDEPAASREFPAAEVVWEFFSGLPPLAPPPEQTPRRDAPTVEEQD